MILYKKLDGDFVKRSLKKKIQHIMFNDLFNDITHSKTIKMSDISLKINLIKREKTI